MMEGLVWGKQVPHFLMSTEHSVILFVRLGLTASSHGTAIDNNPRMVDRIGQLQLIIELAISQSVSRLFPIVWDGWFDQTTNLDPMVVSGLKLTPGN